MSKTHWKKLTNPDYLGAYALEDGQDIILTINFVREETVIGTDGKKDNCVVCHFAENVKPMILNSTNMKAISKLYGSPYIEDWAGRKIQIGVEKVKAFGDIVAALRVRNIIPSFEKKEFPKCEVCGGDIRPTKSMTAEEVRDYTKAKLGKAMCSACANKAVKAQEEQANAQ